MAEVYGTYLREIRSYFHTMQPGVLLIEDRETKSWQCEWRRGLIEDIALVTLKVREMGKLRDAQIDGWYEQNLTV